MIILRNEVIGNTSLTIYSNIIYWSSLKCKRITYSILASKIYIITYSVIITITIRSTLNIIIDYLSLLYVLIVIYIDLLSLYKCLVKLSTTKEKRLIINIMALQEAYEQGELKDIRWIDGRDNPADAITKVATNTLIEQLINTNKMEL